MKRCLSATICQLATALLVTVFAASASAQDAGEAASGESSMLKYKMKKLNGKEVDMAEEYKDQVVLLVNVASECGLTPQYKQLQALHEKYSKEGLAVVGFPCNQFGAQEPGTSDDIQEFCSSRYGVKFDMYEKVKVNGSDACDLYKSLTALDLKPAGKGRIKWNFEKFLVGRDGNVLARFSPRTKPDDPEIIKMIEAELAKK